MVRWDGHLGNHTFRLLSKHDVSSCLGTLYEYHMKQMPRRSLQLPLWRTGEDHQDALNHLALHGWRLSSKIWNPITSPWMKQLTWLRIIHSWDWCLRLVLHTADSTCQKWTNEWMCLDCLIGVVFCFYVFMFLRATACIYAIARICYRPSVCLSVRLSIRPSVTWVDHTKTVEDRIMKLAPAASPMILVFWRQI